MPAFMIYNQEHCVIKCIMSTSNGTYYRGSKKSKSSLSTDCVFLPQSPEKHLHRGVHGSLFLDQLKLPFHLVLLPHLISYVIVPWAGIVGQRIGMRTPSSIYQPFWSIGLERDGWSHMICHSWCCSLHQLCEGVRQNGLKAAFLLGGVDWWPLHLLYTSLLQQLYHTMENVLSSWSVYYGGQFVNRKSNVCISFNEIWQTKPQIFVMRFETPCSTSFLR